jgi:LmbE family N-acetylglucosaminyl deacetylase
MKEPPICLLLLAHPDDEFFILPAIQHINSAGAKVLILFLTDGSAYGVEPENRIEESRNVLAQWGVHPQSIASIGIKLKVADLTLHRNFEASYAAVIEAIKGYSIELIITHSWEGGHPDHDAAHLIGVRLARDLRRSRSIYEFSAYNLWRRWWPFIRCMSLINEEHDEESCHLARRTSLFTAVRWTKSVLGYRSQWRTFLQLMPFCLPQLVWWRRVPLRLVPESRDYNLPPHPGVTISEKRFNVSFTEFQRESARFLDSGLITQE